MDMLGLPFRDRVGEASTVRSAPHAGATERGYSRRRFIRRHPISTPHRARISSQLATLRGQSKPLSHASAVNNTENEIIPCSGFAKKHKQCRHVIDNSLSSHSETVESRREGPAFQLRFRECIIKAARLLKL